ncbi:GntR family transcriptional regulator [Streptomyces sp. DJ]|uniref:aminotransferase-like domain-containing protein n=1 Tax=Streptomyces sp. HB2AG TaxID=2983400 RepID=UPI000CBE67AC|nr:PLP-dependent aminotransferase family protein [Streptomyces sp. HB2AG]MCZ2526466.1 PLP-dependent aminotransferase family protein [Streptomyces sp. HB2AG]PLW74510.1 GntR family transcriptional regulator [Streptomyces sp. DJ]
MTSVSEDVGSAPADPAGAPPGVRLDAAELHASVSDPVLTSMTLLNEIAGRYPDAVSFAAGRPYEGFYEVARLGGHLQTFERHLRDDLGLGPEDVRRTFFQYGRTKGFIHHLIARHLGNDERTVVDPEAVVVTTGCQEAMVLVLRALRRDDRDVVLAAYPAYVGFLGATRIVDMPVRPVAEGPGGIDLADLAVQIRRARAEGLRPRACYVVPDFANPSGVSMSAADRRSLLDLAEREDILVLEDNPYSMFHSGGDRLPTVKSMDTGRRVVYFGSFAKTAFAGARVGYVVADQPMADGALFADELAKLKSMLTLNTSTVAQAVVGGFLLENDCSVERATVREAQVYRRNLRAVLTGLRERFGDHGPVPGSGVSWNVPQGGMFVVVTLPFRADDAVLEYSADRFGVLWTPMHHFYAGDGGSHQIRLSFSVLSAERIGLGLDRLAALVADRVRPGTRTT